MINRRPYVIVDLHWLPLAPSLKYPGARAFGTTGYRASEGPSDLFSVYVKLGEGEPRAGAKQQAKLYALAEGMRDRMPDIGTVFVITAGATAVAECVVRDRGEEEE